MKIICVLHPEDMDRFKAGELIASVITDVIVTPAGRVSMHDGSMLGQVVSNEHEYKGSLAIQRKPPTQLSVVNPVFETDDDEPSTL